MKTAFPLDCNNTANLLASKQGHIYNRLTGICGKVMVTSSPLPTWRSPSQDVSIDAGLKSSKEENNCDYIC